MIRTSRVLALSLLAGLALSAPASAQTEPNSDQPPLMKAAMEEAEQRAESAVRFAFTRTVTQGEESFTARYDPSLPEDQAWTLVSPAGADALSKDMRERWERSTTQPTPDLRILVGYTDPEAERAAESSEDGDGEGEGGGVNVGLGLGGDARLTQEDDARATFAFTPEGSGDGDGMGKFIRGEMVVAKDGPLPESMRFYAPEAFKPSPIAKVKTMDVSLRFAEIAPGGPVAVIENATDISGSAMFKSFEQKEHVVHSDFRLIGSAD